VFGVAPDSEVALDGVSKVYAETTAVDDVSFDVEAGEFFTLVGPSGCGKTTTLRLIGGFESPSSGAVRLGGRDVAGAPPEDRDVGIVFQNYALFPHMTVRENVAYGLKFTDPPDGATTDNRVDDLLDLVDLAGMGDRDPDELSGGQQQRVAMARALAPGPSVLLLDEPMSALDAELRERLRLQILSIQQELGITTVYVTHDQEEALAISDRVAVMRDGAIEQVGTPREIYDRPATRFVAEFVGDNNVFEGQVEAVSDAPDGPTIASVTIDDTTLEISDDDAHLSPGETVVFCVRPEAFVVDGSTNQLETTVESSEFLGQTTRNHLAWQGQELLVRTDRRLRDSVVIGFDPEAAHIVSSKA
jgi:thiamine transport system ATP-binding protein